jgi:phosphohistidine swiveling domain-containing protein
VSALAVEQVERGSLTRGEALARLDPRELSSAWPELVEADPADVLATGIAAGTGVAEGFVCLSPARARSLAAMGLSPILFVHDLDPEDADALRVSAGVVCVRGGITSEAAVMARALGKPCIASGGTARFAEGRIVFDERGDLEELSRVTVDASRGRLVRGSTEVRVEPASDAARAMFEWLGEVPAPLLAGVTTAAHVRTAMRHRTRGIVLTAPHELVHEALGPKALSAPRSSGGADALEEALELALSKLLDAAAGDRDPFTLRVDPTLFAPLPSVVDPLLVARQLAHAGARATRAAGRPLELVTGASSWAPLREAVGAVGAQWSIELLANEEPPQSVEISRIFTPFDTPERASLGLPVVRVARRDALRVALAEQAQASSGARSLEGASALSQKARPLAPGESLACPTSELVVARWWLASTLSASER